MEEGDLRYYCHERTRDSNSQLAAYKFDALPLSQLCFATELL